MNHKIRKVSSYLQKLSDEQYGVSSAVSSAVNYLVDSYFSKVDERNASDPQPWRPSDPISHIFETWLGCDLHKSFTLNKQYPTFSKALQVWALSRLFDGDQSTYDVINYLDQYEFKNLVKNSFELRIQSESINISPGVNVTLPIYGKFFVKPRGSEARLVVTVDFCYNQMGCSVTVMSSPEDKEYAEHFLFDMNASIVANDIYYKQCLTFTSGYLDFMDVTNNSWNDVILKDSVKQNIRNNTVNILEHANTLSSIGMCPNRNVILISPPGMAKTTIFRAISHEINGTMSRMWCTGKSIKRAEDVTSLFQAARSLAPCIVFIEDMDLFGRDRSSGLSDGHVLNEFLACLDGMQENAGVVIMASTNDIASMDEALVARPGRFDVKIEIPLPDGEDRFLMLKKFFKSFSSKPDASVTNETWHTIIELTDGLTGAYIKELAKNTVIRAVSSGRCVNNLVLFCSDDLNAAAQQVIDNFQIGKKAKKHINVEIS